MINKSFKVGDTVQYKNDPKGICWTVDRSDDNGYINVSINSKIPDTFSECSGHISSELRRIDPTLKLGDEVLALAPHSGAPECQGKVGCIKGIGVYGMSGYKMMDVQFPDWPCTVRFDWRTDRLRLVRRPLKQAATAAPKQPLREFLVGDAAVLARVDDEASLIVQSLVGTPCVVVKSSIMVTTVRFQCGVHVSVWTKNLDSVSQDSTPFIVNMPYGKTGPAAQPRKVWTVEEVASETLKVFNEKIAAGLGIPAEQLYRKDDPPRETWSADITLADGHMVRVPDPDPARWELVKRCAPDVVCALEMTENGYVTRQEEGDVLIKRFLVHDEGRCWAKDMARVVNATKRLSPFELRFAHVTEWRLWRKRPARQERYGGSEGILACLW